MTFSGSYAAGDVEFLLKPASIAMTGVADKEAMIQSGARHYSEVLSAEQLPDERYIALYREALDRNAGRLHADVDWLAEQLIARPATHTSCTLVSLARAGTPIGVLLKLALERRGVDVRHYSISIIRDRGIDHNALKLIAARHGTADAVFVDGWTGKGTITRELRRSLADCPFGFAPFLVVVADPAGCASLAATTRDYLIPSGILNGIVSGLVSRSVLNAQLVGPEDFHACAYQSEFAAQDLSREFIAAVAKAAPPSAYTADWSKATAAASAAACGTLLRQLTEEYGVADINHIKPGIAEATRVVLRRVPYAVLLRDPGHADVRHLVHLAHQRGVPIIEADLGNYSAVSIIRQMGGTA